MSVPPAIRDQPEATEAYRAWFTFHGLRPLDTYPDVPRGAKQLGCRNCLSGDRATNPELGLVYCASCPVTVRRDARRLALGRGED